MSEELKNETTSLTEQINPTLGQEINTNNPLGLKEQILEKLANKNKLEPENFENPMNDLKEKLTSLKSLLEKGYLDQQQGQNLLEIIIKSALNNSVNTTVDEVPSQGFDKESAFKEFEQENPGFFLLNGRESILDYLKSDGINFDKDELSKIAKMVEVIEQSAIDRHMKKVAHEQNLEQSNAQAKQRLTSNAQNGVSESTNVPVFTREQIGKMTSAEFLKNESQIMDQLKKGLIR